MNKLTRRDLLIGAGALGCASTLPYLAGDAGSHPLLPFASEKTDKPLRDHAAGRGLLYGAAVGQAVLTKDGSLADLCALQCSMVVSENDLKWKGVHPKRNEYDFSKGDWLLQFAESHEMKMRGHNLVWHDYLPDWLQAAATSSNAQSLMEEHITRVMGHYRGKLHSWDVVNEPFHAEDGREDGMRESLWLRLAGPGYVETALHIARQADPTAFLCLNENHIDAEDAISVIQRRNLLRCLKDFKRRNVPIDALGIEAHLNPEDSPTGGPLFRRFLQEVEDLGLKILVTEMDVADWHLPVNIAFRDQAVAQCYYEYLTAVLHRKATIAVLTWGLSNRNTWLAKARRRWDGAAVRPLPFDDQLRPTLAFKAIARAFDEAPSRP